MSAPHTLIEENQNRALIALERELTAVEKELAVMEQERDAALLEVEERNKAIVELMEFVDCGKDGCNCLRRSAVTAARRLL